MRESGAIRMVGITQEQHPERCRLFAQWKGFDWPILWDPFNLSGSRVVPTVLAVDEHGVVRHVNPKCEMLEGFLASDFPAPAEASAATASSSEPADLGSTPARVFARAHLEALSDLLRLRPERMDAAVEQLERDARERPSDGPLAFHAGVARRLRYDWNRPHSDDFQAALDHWTRALALDPNQYIWRRRIQQYGPRQDKPYPFYDWTAQAAAEIHARGETPVELAAELTPAELAQMRRFEAAPAAEEPDPSGRIARDERGWISVESAVAFDTSGDQPLASVHLALRPDAGRKIHWNDEAGPMVLWLGAPDLPAGWQLDARRIEHRGASGTATDEVRRFTFDLRLPAGVEQGVLTGYVLFNACEGTDGTCILLRKDFEVRVRRGQGSPH
jgi:hypothetical protein